MQDKKGFFSLVLNGVFLGTYGIWIRFFQNSFNGYQQVIARSGAALFFGLVIAFLLQSKWSFQRKYTKHLSFYLLSFFLSTLLFTFGVIETSIALSVFSFYIGSIVSAFILGFIFFKEKITKIKIISIILALFALISFVSPFSKELFNIGIITSLFAGIFDGIGNAFKKYFGGKIERPTLIVYQTFSTLLIALIVALFVHQPILSTHLSASASFLMVLYGGIFLSVAYLSMYGFQHFNLNLGTIIISSELFWAPFFAFLIFHETLTWYEILGGVFIGAAILVPYLKTLRKLK